MIPIITLIGKPNVGKSTIFNKLTKTNEALTGNFTKLTYDRKYGSFKWNKYKFIIIDTGGIESINKNQIEIKIIRQTLIAIEEADIILFIINNKSNLLINDVKIAKHLINRKKLTILVINKINNINENFLLSSLNCLNIKNIISIYIYHEKDINKLLIKIVSLLKINNLNYKINSKPKKLNIKNKPIKIAIVGCANVGKSTFVNLIANEERIIVLNTPGTTRDNIYIPVRYKKKNYILIDTAGINKKSTKKNTLEKISTINTLKIITQVDINLLIIDIQNSISDLNLSLLEFIISNKKPIIIIINKLDIIPKIKHNEIKKNINIKLKFIKFIKIIFISALYNQGIKKLFNLINTTYKKINKKIKTSNINSILHDIINNITPPKIKGKKIKFKYIHIGSQNPLIIIIHGTNVCNTPDNYKNYMINYFKYRLNINNIPIQIQFNEKNYF